jgi:hypothetical protein
VLTCKTKRTTTDDKTNWSSLRGWPFLSKPELFLG